MQGRNKKGFCHKVFSSACLNDATREGSNNCKYCFMAPLKTGARVEKLVISEYFTDCSSFLHSCTHVLLPLFENWGIFVLKIILCDQCLGSWRCGPVIPLHSFTSSAKTNRILTRSVITLKTVVQNS